MTKKEWIQALLDGKTMTSNWADGQPLIFDGKVFRYKAGANTDITFHDEGLREYFEYPMWFKATNRDYVVKFTSLSKGTVVHANNTYEVGHKCKKWVRHTNKNVWIQVEDPITTKEVTMEELEAHYGCKVKIVKDK